MFPVILTSFVIFIFYHLSKAINTYYFSKQWGKNLSPVGISLSIWSEIHTSLPVTPSVVTSEQSTCRRPCGSSLCCSRATAHPLPHVQRGRTFRVQGDEGDVVADVLAS